MRWGADVLAAEEKRGRKQKFVLKEARGLVDWDRNRDRWMRMKNGQRTVDGKG